MYNEFNNLRGDVPMLEKIELILTKGTSIIVGVLTLLMIMLLVVGFFILSVDVFCWSIKWFMGLWGMI